MPAGGEGKTAGRSPARVAWDVYNLSATLAARRFASTYRRHVAMLGLFFLMVLFTVAAIIQIAARAVESSDSGDIADTITPGGIAAAAFALLLIRGAVDVSRGVLRDRALWSILTSPAREGAVRSGLLLRTLVFQMGLLAAVLGLVALVLATSPTPPELALETIPMVVLAGAASGTLPLPLLVSAGRDRHGLAVAVVLLALAGAFFAAMQLGWSVWAQAASGVAVIVASVATAALAPPALAGAWTSANRPPPRRERTTPATPPMFRPVAAGLDPVGRALFRKEVQLGFTLQQRLSIVALNIAIGAALVTLDRDLSRLVGHGPIDWNYYHFVVTPFIVGLGVYAVSFFQATSPLLDGITKEGPSLWVLKTSPADPRTIVESKVRPLLAFLPLTVLAVGISVPLAGGRGPAAIAVGALGTAAVYMAFAGVGAWAGARYPNVDRHSNVPPDLVLAFDMMVACLAIEAAMLLPVLAASAFGGAQAVAVAAVALLAGFAVYRVGIDGGARALGTLQLSG